MTRRHHLGTPIRWAPIVLCAILLAGLAVTRAQADRPRASVAPSGRAGRRVIVQLESAPLVRAMAVHPPRRGRALDLKAPQAARCLSRLRANQDRLSAAARRAVPGCVIERAYQIVFNGLVVRVPDVAPEAVDRLRALPGVCAVYEEAAFRPALYASLPAIGAQTLWDDLGGPDSAGAGITIAVLDSGIAIEHPMFDGEGYAYPAGFPQGDARYATPKVVASRAYFRPTDPPLPGEDKPVPGALGSGHGTHLAGIAAGNPVTATYRGLSQQISGVAPRAWLLNYRVFYPSQARGQEVAYTTEIVQAIEDAVEDGADVLCAGWASATPRLPIASPVAQALEGAIEAGCVVVAAAGNQGPAYGSSSRVPGGVERVITVGATSKDQAITCDWVDVTGPEPVPAGLQGQRFARALFGAEIEALLGPLPYIDVGEVDLDQSRMACQPLPEGLLEGQVALISRGDCAFADKAYNAEQAGAVIALIYNHTDDLLEMGCGGDHCDPGEIGIPAALVAHSFGQDLLAWRTIEPSATLQLDPDGRIVSSVADQVASSSARGPAYARYLKPDLVAPGVLVLSAYYDPTGGTESYAQLSGTSTACAHVAGGAALLLQAHPTWGHDQVKAALMATSRRTGLDMGEGEPAGALERGTGLVDLPKAASLGFLVSPPSFAFPFTVAGGSYTATVSLRDIREAGEPVTFTTSISCSQGITIGLPALVAAEAGLTTTVNLTVAVLAGASEGVWEGDLRLASGEGDLHVPLWVQVQPELKAAEVLLIDNDFSNFECYVNYAPYITGALEAADASYQVWDADLYYSHTQTIPDLAQLQAYDAVIWLTGDHAHPDGYYAVPTPLTSLDMQILANYLDGGGRLVALGQNLAQASDVNSSADPIWGRASLYHNHLGAHWVQGSLFDPSGQGLYPPSEGLAVVGLPGSFLANVELDLGQEGDGQGNQTSVDEIAPGGQFDGSDLDLVQPLMVAVAASPAEAGYVAVAKSCEPTLEEMVAACPYRTLYYSFGLEGINHNAGRTTRDELLSRSLDWLLDEVSVSLEPVVSSPKDPTRIECQATSSVGAEVVSYRWRLGSEIVAGSQPSVICAFDDRGSHPVAVEVTDALGHKAITQTTALIVDGGSSTLTVTHSRVVPGQELTYQIAVSNTAAYSLPVQFTLPLPQGTEYISHTGGSYEGGVLTWSAQVDSGATSRPEVTVQVLGDAQPGGEIVATAQFQAGEDEFTKAARTRVLYAMQFPLMMKQ